MAHANQHIETPHPAEIHGHAPSHAFDTWLFNAQAVATLGFSLWCVYEYYLQLGVFPKDGPLAHFYQWASCWWFALLIAVFYLAAGYLYQRYQSVTSFRDFLGYMRREIIILAVPYVSFTVLVLLGNSLVGQSPGFSLQNLVTSLFITPIGSIGYFGVLFFIFLITRTPRTNRGAATLMACAIAAKVASLVLQTVVPDFYNGLSYFICNVMENWVWFVTGAFLSKYKAERVLEMFPFAFVVSAFFALYLVIGCLQNLTSDLYVMSVVFFGLFTFFSVAHVVFKRGRNDKFFGFVGKYTMAIWLMHPILAQITVWALGLVGITSSSSFGGAGLPVLAVALPVACYVLPVVVLMVLNRTWKFSFIVYPARYLKG